MPWTRPHRWISFLLLVSVLALGVALGVISSRNRVGGNMSPTEERVIGACLGLSAFGLGFARMEYLQRKNKHDANGRMNAIGLMAQEAAINAAEAKKGNETLPARVVRELNGGIDKAVQKQLDASPFPTTPEQLRDFIAASRGEDCKDIALNAARQAVQENMAMLRAEGVIREQA